ncbi:Transcription elongation factor B polypeptide 3-like protein [Aphelenchoides fujianensis]|nr:Transcription elongation factor B polypeptide 3-like protein [Aphelenchoides fujianensis]
MSSDPTAFRSNARMKVYAGRRKAQQFSGDVPLLVQLCQRFLSDNVDQLEEVGDVPFHLLQPTLASCTADQHWKKRTASTSSGRGT